MNKQLFKISAFVIFLLSSLRAAAQDRPEPASELSNPVAIVLLTVVIGLFIAIIILGNAVIASMDIYRERMKKAAKATLTVLILLGATQGIAQTTSINGLSQTSFYMLVTVIALEISIIISLLFTLRILIGIERKKRIKKIKPGKPLVSWLDKLNDTKSLDADSEADVDMGHDFDGIRELNNPTPPWWRYGFYCSIVFAVIYMWRFQIVHAAPSQLEELAIAEKAATEEKAAYLKNAANNIDEKTVKLLTDPTDFAAAQKLFSVNCSPCHGQEGQGVVGPNLTDNYWLHGGKINDIFSTIKYGVADKGMKAWKDDFSPKQLAQLASYIKSIQGSNPPNPKEKQGILYGRD
jgi:cytochrome c oxidase cbb3-type subunit 3